MISIIIPVINEAGFIENMLQSLLLLKDEADFEILIADGGSSDATIQIASQHARIVKSPAGRAIQQNTAARQASGDIFFFAHAHMIIPRGTLRTIRETITREGYDGGGFSNLFSEHNERIKRLGRILNFRLFDNDHDENTIFFGDNGIFVRRSVFEAMGGFREIPIMEDYDFSQRLRKNYQVKRILQPRLLISPRRHLENGFLKTRLQWILIKRLYLMGISPERLNRWYRRV